ncbi:MAG TPA: hypothetical protein VGI46_02100 [Candidatus Acidoferrum sp.]|jgi:hypothetical protein
MTSHPRISFCLAVVLTATPLRAANRPHAGTDRQNTMVWTNDDLERLKRTPGLISIVGQVANEDVQDVDAPEQRAEDLAWYAAQAAALNARLETEQANLRDFTQALDDARELKSTTAGVNLAEAAIGITPEATIEILQNQVRETQGELDALADLARRNSIPPGVLRDQWPGVPEEQAVPAAEISQRDMSAPEGDL